jgi:hypothetical protein
MHEETRLSDSSSDMPPELTEEKAAWQQGSAEALALVERLAEEEGRGPAVKVELLGEAAARLE